MHRMRWLLAFAFALPLLAQDPPAETERGKSPCRPLAADGAAPELAKLLRQFAADDREFEWTLTKKRDQAKWTQYELTFASPVKTDVEENNTVPCKVWVPKDDQKRRPAAVLLHWLGGSFEMLELAGARLAEKGVTTLMLWMPHYGKRRAKDKAKREEMITLDNDRTLANFRQAVLDIRRAGDWLASRRDVEPSRIGLMGISLGAVVGSLVCGVDTNFRRCAFVVGGGDLPAVAMHGSKETIDIKRKAEELGITQEKLTEMWHGIEPCTYASRLERSNVLMINAENDQVFPRACTEKLWEAVGRPEIVWVKADHYTWALQMGKILDQIGEHLKTRETYVSPQPPRYGAPAIRVLIRESADEIALDVPGACDVLRPGAADPLETAVKIGRATVRADRGVTVGDRRWPEPWIVLSPRGTWKAGDRTYEGSLHLIATRAGGLHAIVELDLERYVAGVVGCEIPASSPAEALKAQAVCARTYAYFTWLETARSAQRAIFDVYDDVKDQVYKGVPEPGGACEKAAEATAGRIVTWKEKPIKAFFSSTCGGTPESAAEVFGSDVPPLGGGRCGACGHAKYASWTLRLSGADLSKSLSGLAGGAVKGVAVSSQTRTGRVARVTVARADGVEVLVAGPEFRKTLGYDKFRSTKFSIERDGDTFVFSGQGWGHGVGLCQEGAIGLAKSGETWEAIVARYYPGGEVKKLY